MQIWQVSDGLGLALMGYALVKADGFCPYSERGGKHGVPSRELHVPGGGLGPAPGPLWRRWLWKETESRGPPVITHMIAVLTACDI